MTRKRAIMLVGIFGVTLILGILVFGNVDVVKSAPLEILSLVQKYQDAEIGLGTEQRYHMIHSEEEQELTCDECHTTNIPANKAIFFNQDVSPDNDEGPINKTRCQGCHEEDSDLPLYRAE